MVASTVAIFFFVCGDYYGNQAMCAQSKDLQAIAEYQRGHADGIVVRDVDSGVYTYVPSTLNYKFGINALSE